MRRSIWEKIEEILRKHILHGKWVRSIIALSCVVIFITTYVLVMPAVTLSGTPDCGQEEHRHTDDCYETQSEQICGLEEHTHSDDCYDEDGNLICGLEEHAHNDGCYETEKVLTCGMEEHIHTSDCYNGADAEDADPEDSSSSAGDAGEAESKTEQGEDVTDEVNSEDAETVASPEATEAADPEGPAESEEPASGNLLAEGEDYTITVSYTEEANLPADVSLKVEEITNKEEYEGYKSQVEEEILDPESQKVTAARFFDITLLDSEDNELHPEKAVTVVIETKDTLKENEEVQVCHFDQEQEKPVIVKSQEIINETYEEDNLGVQFEAETFYVYGIVRTKPIGTTVLTADGETYTVTVSYTEEANLPADVSLKVEEITNTEEYEGYKSQVEEEILDPESKKVTAARFFDITLMDSDGNELHPEKAVTVVIETKDTWKENEEVQVCHFDQEQEKPVIVKSQEIINETYEEDNLGVQFEAESFSVYGIVGTETITVDYLTASGDTYQITVNIPEDAGIPKDSDLVVEEIFEGTEEYNTYVSRILEMLGTDEIPAYLTFAHLFDITIMHNGQEIQPQKDVTVKIELKEGQDLSDTTKVSTIHFAETGAEIIVPETEGTEKQLDAVTFSTDGFSVYAVVGEGDQGDYARMTVEFYNGETKIASMIVKNSDDAEEVEKILYDPGAGDVQPGQLFKGWIMENPNYTSEDVADAKTIVDIRNWAVSKTITEHETVKFYAMIFNTYSVSFLNEKNATLHGEALIFKAGSYADYTINVPYTPIDPEAKFDGWYWTSDTAGAVKLADGSDAPEKLQNGTAVRISGNVVFTVDAPNGHWISFVSNGTGATYTAPQFVAKDGGTSTKPNDPTRLGYRFAGWNTAADGSGETWLTVTYDNAGNPSYSNNKFGTELTARTELYAQWTPVATANYSVIIWKQRVSDDKNASDANKTYDVAEVITLTGNVGSTINVVNQNGNSVNTGRGTTVRNYSVNGSQKAYTGFHAARYDRNVTISPEGISVLNVYYDRNLISIIFHPYTAGGTRYYILNENTGNWSNNNVTYTGLYDAPLDFTWPTTAARNSYGYDILWHTGSNNGNLTLSFYGSYKHYIPANVTDTMYLVGAGDVPIRFIRQKIDGTWPSSTSDTDSVLTIFMDGGTFNLSEKYTGFSIKDYRTSNYTTSESDWTAARNNDGSLKSVRYSSQLNIRFTRDKYPINFFDGTYFNGNGVVLQEATKAPLGKSEEIYYEASTASYNKGGEHYFVPTAPDGYTFGGWFVDPTCTTPYTFTTMPVGGITVYAKWVQTQYRVFLHPNVPSGDPLAWGDSQQTASFRVDWGKKVAEGVTIDGERPGYDLIGWYFDEACTIPFNFDAYVLNDDTVTEAYDTTDDGIYNPTANTELDKYGDVIAGQDGVNKDADANRFWITRQLHLYAKWRSVLDGAEGIYVIYDANGGTNPPKDPLTYYLDKAQATAQAASTPPYDAENPQQFLYWVVQKWDEAQNAYVDTDVKVYPGDTFEVLKDDARVQAITDGTQTEKIYNIYTVQLRAEYGDIGAPTPTHIHWYANNTSGDFKVSLGVGGEDALQINEAVSIKPANTFTYDGHKFLGWARINETTDHPDHPELNKISDCYLVWNYENKQFELQDGTVVTEVAADDITPYHDMYAVWEQQKYTVTINKVVTEGGLDSDYTKRFQIGWSYGNTTTNRDYFVHGEAPKTITTELTYGTVFTVEELYENDFDATYAAVRVTDDQKEAITPEDVTPETAGTGQFKITGDTNITVTNTRNTQNIVFEKTIDDSQLGSEQDVTDIVFTLTDTADSSKTYSASPAENGLVTFNSVSVGTYNLAETVVLTGYKAIATHTVTVTKAGYTITLDGVEIEKNDNDVYTIHNELDTTDIVLKKVNEEGDQLENAKFTLTTYTGGENGSYADAKEVVAGKTTIEGLTVGTKYLLTEDDAPSGYVIKQNKYYFQIELDGRITLTEEDGTVIETGEYISKDGNTITIINPAGQALPHTGGPGTLLYTLSGIALMLGAALMYGFRMRRRERRLN